MERTTVLIELIFAVGGVVVTVAAAALWRFTAFADRPVLLEAGQVKRTDFSQQWCGTDTVRRRRSRSFDLGRQTTVDLDTTNCQPAVQSTTSCSTAPAMSSNSYEVTAGSPTDGRQATISSTTCCQTRITTNCCHAKAVSSSRNCQATTVKCLSQAAIHGCKGQQVVQSSKCQTNENISTAGAPPTTEDTDKGIVTLMSPNLCCGDLQVNLHPSNDDGTITDQNSDDSGTGQQSVNIFAAEEVMVNAGNIALKTTPSSQPRPILIQTSRSSLIGQRELHAKSLPKNYKVFTDPSSLYNTLRRRGRKYAEISVLEMLARKYYVRRSRSLPRSFRRTRPSDTLYAAASDDYVLARSRQPVLQTSSILQQDSRLNHHENHIRTAEDDVNPFKEIRRIFSDRDLSLQTFTSEQLSCLLRNFSVISPTSQSASSGFGDEELREHTDSAALTPHRENEFGKVSSNQQTTVLECSPAPHSEDSRLYSQLAYDVSLPDITPESPPDITPDQLAALIRGVSLTDISLDDDDEMAPFSLQSQIRCSRSRHRKRRLSGAAPESLRELKLFQQTSV